MNREEQFHDEMIRLCQETTEAVYNPGYFRNMVSEQGGLVAVKALLNARGLSDGFTRLWEANRLDLTVEAVALLPQWAPLFTHQELATARQRLEDLGYNPQPSE